MILGLAGLFVVGGVLVGVAAPLVSLGSTPTPSPTPTATTPSEVRAFDTAPPVDPSGETGGTLVAMPSGPADPYANFVPDKCPDGTVAGKVDSYGNESNCQAAPPAG